MPIDPNDPRLRTAHTAAPDRYSHAPHRTAGHSGVKLPAVSLGLWQNFGDDSNSNTRRSILLHAFDHGITHFDLANNYGPPYGSAETNFGAILASDLRAYRDELFISTKAGYDMWPGPYGDGGSRKHLLSSLNQSLARLQVEYVDVYYSHRPDPETPIEETVGSLITAVQSGKALYVGLSNYTAAQGAAAATLLRDAGIPVLLHQPRYSMLDRTAEGGLFAQAHRDGAGCAVFSPLAQGLLTDKYLDGRVPADSRAARSAFLDSDALTDDYLSRISGIARIAAELEVSIPVLAIAWVLRNDVVTTAIVGASRTSQIDDAIAASHVRLSDHVAEQLAMFLPAPGSCAI